MQKHFTNRSHNFAKKLADIKSQVLLEVDGREKDINNAITHILTTNQAKIDDKQKFIKLAIEIVKTSANKKWEQILIPIIYLSIIYRNIKSGN